jgi:hypothetical protein
VVAALGSGVVSMEVELGSGVVSMGTGVGGGGVSTLGLLLAKN